MAKDMEAAFNLDAGRIKESERWPGLRAKSKQKWPRRAPAKAKKAKKHRRKA